MKKLYSHIETVISFVDKTAKLFLLLGVVAETLQFFGKRSREVMGIKQDEK